MKKTSSATLRFASALALAALASGCSTTDHKSVEKWQGQVWRTVVVKQFVDSTSFKGAGKEWIEATRFDPTKHTGLRMARIHLSSGWDSVIANAIVPDNIEFSQLEKGTIVDVKTETGPDIDHSVARFTRILGIVCANDDKACIDKEDKAGHIRRIVDAHPPSNVSSKYGATYNRRVTPEELKKYD